MLMYFGCYVGRNANILMNTFKGLKLIMLYNPSHLVEATDALPKKQYRNGF